MLAQLKTVELRYLKTGEPFLWLDVGRYNIGD